MADDARLQRLSRELFFAATAELESLPEWVVDRMMSMLEEGEVSAGQTIFKAGDPPEFIYFMRQGRVRLEREGVPSWTYEGRWALGLFEIIRDEPRARTATALADFRLLRVRGDAWIDLLEDSFVLARAALENSARTIAALADDLASSGGDPPATGASLMSLPQGELNLIERLAVLFELQHLRGSGVQPLAELAAVADEVAYEPGQRFLESGVRKDRSFAVLDGEVEASRVDPPIVRNFGRGALVLGAASCGQASVPWEARAKTRTRLLTFRQDDWFDLLEEHFDMVRAALGALALERERILEAQAARSGNLILR